MIKYHPWKTRPNLEESAELLKKAKEYNLNNPQLMLSECLEVVIDQKRKRKGKYG